MKKFFNVEVVGLKSGGDFSVRRQNRRVGAKVFPNKGNRDVAAGVFRLALIELDLANFERLPFGLGDRLEIHFVAPQENGRNIQALRRIGCVRS